MIKIVTINSNQKDEKAIHKIIDKSFMKYNFYYEYYNFNHDNKRLDQYLKENHKTSVYFIIDNNGDSLEVINKIRNEFQQHYQFIFIININNINDINKINNDYPFNTKIIEDLNTSENDILNCASYIANIVNNKKDCITIKSEGFIKKIPFEEILYIEKEANSKNCIIVGISENYIVKKPLKYIMLNLSQDFVQTHQSAIININNVKKIDLKNKKIVFINGVVCSLISRGFHKDLKKIIVK